MFLRNFYKDNIKKDKKIQDVIQEFLKYDLKTKRLKLSGFTVYLKCANGGYVLSTLSELDVINYILMPIGEVLEIIPYEHIDELDLDLNKSFHDYISGVKKSYRAKAITYLDERKEKRRDRIAILTLIVTIIGLFVTIISVFISILGIWDKLAVLFI